MALIGSIIYLRFVYNFCLYEWNTEFQTSLVCTFKICCKEVAFKYTVNPGNIIMYAIAHKSYDIKVYFKAVTVYLKLITNQYYGYPRPKFLRFNLLF